MFTDKIRRDISIRKQKKGNQGISSFVLQTQTSQEHKMYVRFQNFNLLFPIRHTALLHFFQTCWKLSFHWIPGHKGHSGNTMADTLASTGSAGHGHPFHLPSSLHTLKAKINRSVKSFWEHHHESHSCKASGFTRDLFPSLPADFYLHTKLPTLTCP